MNNIKLWEKTPLFEEAHGQKEPTLTPYLLDGVRDAGCIIVLPGGGYSGRAHHEGEPIAKMYNAAGMHAFVLNYRCYPYHYPCMMYDVQRAVRLVRARADEFGVNPDKIATIGFSAGGHLATVSATQFDYGYGEENTPEDYGEIDEIDRVSCRPDATVLCYAVCSLGEFTHVGTRNIFLGDLKDDLEMRRRFSGEYAVRKDMPQCFFWHTFDDGCVDVRNSLNMAYSMREIDVPFEMHIYPHGDHGLGLAKDDPVVSKWAAASVKWLQGLGF